MTKIPSVEERVAEIYTSQGFKIILDEADYKELSKFKWGIKKCRRTSYAKRTFTVNGVDTLVIMHRVIMDAPKGLQVDHINGNGLDNRRSNLRLCTNQQNQQNRRPTRNSSSKYKGVSFSKQRQKWEAQMKCGTKRFNLGHFALEEDAARAYNKKAIELSGEFAYINII